MKPWKRIGLAMLAIAIFAVGYGIYLYNQKPVDTRQSDTVYELTAKALTDEFNADETMANKKYLDKVIAVIGKVTDIKIDSATAQATVILDSGDPMAAITCSFYNDEIQSVGMLKQGDTVSIKGICTGKLMDVVLNKCSIKR